MLDMSGVSLAIDVLARPATLRRFNPANAWVDGIFDETAGASDVPIMAVIQAASQEDLRLVPEGERAEGYVTVWSRTEMNTSDETSRGRADLVIGEDGNTYKVVRKSARTEGGYFRVIGRLERHDSARRL